MYNQEYQACLQTLKMKSSQKREEKTNINKYKANIPHLDFPLCNHGYKPEYNHNSVIAQVLKKRINAILSSGYKNKSKL